MEAIMDFLGYLNLRLRLVAQGQLGMPGGLRQLLFWLARPCLAFQWHVLAGTFPIQKRFCKLMYSLHILPRLLRNIA